jgi:uncharacterized protein (TIGR02145 family)
MRSYLQKKQGKIKLGILLFKLIIFLFFILPVSAQQGINYKAIINDDAGNALTNSAIAVQFTILENGATAVYSESHDTTTDANGIIIVNIGKKNPTVFNTIDWGGAPHYLKTEIDIGNGLTDLGTTELNAVPYALYAAQTGNNDDADADPTNELQFIRISNDTIYLSGGGFLKLPASGTQGWDLNARNEIITNLANPNVNSDAANKGYVDDIKCLLYKSCEPNELLDLGVSLPEMISCGITYDQILADGILDTALIGLGAPLETLVSNDFDLLDLYNRGYDVVQLENAGAGIGEMIDAGIPEQVLVDSGFIGSLTDIDGNTYKWVKLDDQVWMANYLRTTRYNTGEEIPLVEGPKAWTLLNSPGYCWYENNEEYVDSIYGAIYNWLTVMNGDLCPDGWRVPDTADCKMLSNYIRKIGYSSMSLNNIGFSIAPKVGMEYNIHPYRLYATGYFGNYHHDYTPDTWTTTEIGRLHASVGPYNSSFNKKYGLFIRCIQGEENIIQDKDGDGFTILEGDCCDIDSTIHPKAIEYRDSEDNNCNGEVDEDAICLPGWAHCSPYYPSYVCETNIFTDRMNCGECGNECPSGFDCINGECIQVSFDTDGDGFASNEDCDDTDPSIYPGAVEICDDDIDQDCSGSDLSCLDVDDDGDGYTENQGDCDDNNALLNPDAEDVCGDGTDQDCNGYDAVCPITDIDGNVYQVVQIGEQFWMAENLKTTRYNDGELMPLVKEDSNWFSMTEPAYSWPNNDSLDIELYGLYYNWYVVESGKVCPTGWHVPAQNEWIALEDFLTMEGYDNVPITLASQEHWPPGSYSSDYYCIGYNPSGNNEFGFSGLPAASRLEDEDYYDVYGQASWWMSNEFSEFRGQAYKIRNYYCQIKLPKEKKNSGLTIRCIKD